MSLEKGWLARQSKKIAEEIKTWPKWMQPNSVTKSKHPFDRDKPLEPINTLKWYCNNCGTTFEAMTYPETTEVGIGFCVACASINIECVDG